MNEQGSALNVQGIAMIALNWFLAGLFASGGVVVFRFIFHTGICS